MGAKQRRVGYLGGTFDPVHFGHLHLALELAERHALDLVLFSPTAVSPFKLERPPLAPLQARFAMLQAATAALPYCLVWDGELRPQIEGKGAEAELAYTVNALRLLQKEMPDAHFHLLMGEDALHGFERWREVEALVRLAPPLVGTRACQGIPFDSFPDHLRLPLLEGWTPLPSMEISGSVIRERLLRGKYCGHLVPHEALDYIAAHHLYRDQRVAHQQSTR